MPDLPPEIGANGESRMANGPSQRRSTTETAKIVTGKPRASARSVFQNTPPGMMRVTLGFAIPLWWIGGCASASIQSEPVYFPRKPDTPRVVHLKSFNRLDELVLIRAGFLDRLRGRIGSSRVGTPAGMAFRNDTLYICDTDDNVVHVWNLASGRASRIGDHGPVTLSKPVSVAVDDAGTLFVADTGRGEVVAYPGEADARRTFRGNDRESYRPVAAAVRDGRLYVADIAAHSVDAFSIDDGRWIESIGGVGTSPGRFYFPMGVGFDQKGRLLVSDMMNARVQRFDVNAAPEISFGSPGNRLGNLGKPRHVAVGPDEILFVADAEFAHVHLFDEQGRLLMLLGGPHDRAGGTPMPVGLAVAQALPDAIAALVPQDFHARYFVFVSNSVGAKRLSLFAVGVGPAP